jgi:hypothetical protein
MQFRIFKRGDIVETADGKLGVVSAASAATISVDLIVRKSNLCSVSGYPTEFTYVPATKKEKEYICKKGLMNLNDYNK